MTIDTAYWLFGAPQFWLGVVACAAFVFLAMAPTALRPRRTVEVYRVYERAPTPLRDPFYKPGSEMYSIRSARVEARRQSHHRTGRIPVAGSRTVHEARKRAVWHPHPDDELPPWKLLW